MATLLTNVKAATLLADVKLAIILADVKVATLLIGPLIPDISIILIELKNDSVE